MVVTGCALVEWLGYCQYQDTRLADLRPTDWFGRVGSGAGRADGDDHGSVVNSGDLWPNEEEAGSASWGDIWPGEEKADASAVLPSTGSRTPYCKGGAVVVAIVIVIAVFVCGYFAGHAHY